MTGPSTTTNDEAVEARVRQQIAAEFEAMDPPGLHWVISFERAARVVRGDGDA